jgi:hypothetical protein
LDKRSPKVIPPKELTMIKKIGLNLFQETKTDQKVVK